MKETNTKPSEPVEINQYQKKMDKIATKMAAYFDERIKASALAEWISTTVQCCIDFPSDKVPTYDPIIFLHTIGWTLLPELIDCGTQKERIMSLKKQLIYLYECERYEGTESFLHELNCCYLRQVKKYGFGDGEEVYRHMNIYGSLLSLLEIYKEYRQVELEKEAA